MIKRRPKTQKINLEKFIELFYNKKLPNKEICKYFNVQESAIGIFRKRNNLPPRGHSSEKPHNWKGGRYINKQGYVMILKKGFTGCDKKGYVKEHRYIYSTFYKITLTNKDIIHHINGDKTDNRIENLQLLDNKSHLILHYPKGSKFGKNIMHIHM